jgi:hypothetical protein
MLDPQLLKKLWVFVFNQKNMNKLKCGFCGKEFKKVCSHVWMSHHMTAREYKKMLGFDVKKGILTDNLRLKLRNNAIVNGMIERLKQAGIKTRFSKDNTPKNYKRSSESITRLKKHGKTLPRPKKKIQPRLCKNCKKEFMPVYSKAKYCSQKCYQEFDPIAKRIKI